MPTSPDPDSYRFELEIYVERVEDSPFAERVCKELVDQVSEIAPWIELHAEVLGTAGTIAHNRVEYQGVPYHAPWCKPRAPGLQTMLLTHDPFPLGAEGFGGRVGCVVSVERYEAKAARGEPPVDITVHEWLHTIEGETIRGRPVPYADDAERFRLRAGRARAMAALVHLRARRASDVAAPEPAAVLKLRDAQGTEWQSS